MKNFLSKTLAVLLSIVATFTAVPALTGASAAELDYDEFDTVFLDTAEQTVPDFYIGEVQLSANKEILYDVDLNELGFIYDFTVGGEDGYATVIDYEGTPELSGIFFGTACPFNALELTNYYRIYVSGCTYLYFYNGAYYTLSGEEIPQNSLDNLRENAYLATNSYVVCTNETIYYVTKTITASNELAYRYPMIDDVVGHSNCCVPIAGANIIQFWDRYKPNLIPNYEPGGTLLNYYLYKTSDDELNDLAYDLYVAMETNSTGDGTTITQCMNGFNSFITSKGYTFSYESCMTNSAFNFTIAKQKIDAVKPLILFVDVFSVATIHVNSDNDYITYRSVNGAHAMAGFGYKTITYTLSNNTTRTDNYIGVSSGLNEVETGYYNISLNTQIDNAYAINIT